jgi:type IV secretory pathway VirB3-like protein
MTNVPSLKSSSFAYVRITASGITANLVQLGTSMITHGNQQDLLLDPGSFSIDPDEDSFDPTVNIDEFENSFLLFLYFRNGNIHIIVDFMVYIIFPIYKVYYYRLMILELILTIHHVYQINQVKYFNLFDSYFDLSKTKGNRTTLIYRNSSLSPQSSLIILGGSLQTNQIYQFMVYMENRENSYNQATGYVLVTVESTNPQLIAIGYIRFSFDFIKSFL